MTPTQIHDHLFMSFKALYPTMPITIEGAGEEVISVTIMMDGFRIHWVCELDSDDDGNFRFMLDDTILVLTIPYPEF